VSVVGSSYCVRTLAVTGGGGVGGAAAAELPWRKQCGRGATIKSKQGGSTSLKPYEVIHDLCLPKKHFYHIIIIILSSIYLYIYIYIFMSYEK